LKKRNLVILSLAFFLAVAAFGASSSPVFAQTPCIAQASYPVVSSAQYNSNIAVTVPVSTSCSYTVGPLFAVGDAYDTSISTGLGTVSTGLSLVGGGSYNGQLLFSLPASALGHTVQFSVSIYNNYNGQSGSPLATTSQSITIGSSYNQSYCQPGYSSIGGTCYPPTYNSNCYNGSYYYASSCYPGYSNNYYSSNYYGGTSNGNGNWNHGNGNGNWNNGNGNWNHGNGNSNWSHGNWNGNNNGNNGNWNGNSNHNGYHHKSP